MKKAIKDYLAKLQDNKKDKGFSLVELIIVIAIMAILVGVVASQVLPYIEKSRRSKDTEMLNNVSSDMVTAIADAMADGSQTAANFSFVATSATYEPQAADTGVGAFGKLVYDKYKANKLNSDGKPLGDVWDDLKSKACKTDGTKGYTVTYNNTNNTVTVTSNDGASLIKIESKLQ